MRERSKSESKHLRHSLKLHNREGRVLHWCPLSFTYPTLSLPYPFLTCQNLISGPGSQSEVVKDVSEVGGLAGS